jgi:hypothetical protein
LAVGFFAAGCAVSGKTAGRQSGIRSKKNAAMPERQRGVIDGRATNWIRLGSERPEGGSLQGCNRFAWGADSASERSGGRWISIRLKVRGEFDENGSKKR